MCHQFSCQLIAGAGGQARIFHLTAVWRFGSWFGAATAAGSHAIPLEHSL